MRKLWIVTTVRIDLIDRRPIQSIFRRDCIYQGIHMHEKASLDVCCHFVQGNTLYAHQMFASIAPDFLGEGATRQVRNIAAFVKI